MEGPQEQKPRVWIWIVIGIVILIGGVCVLIPAVGR